MTYYICATCGTQYPEAEQPPARCPICEDERQYVNPGGQRWTTLDDLRQNHHNLIELAEPRLHRIKTEPKLGIGQQAFLVQTPGGNLLWDCITLIDAATIDALQKLGGIQAIAVSHPHYHSAVVEWSRAFDNAPVYIHAGNREWVTRPDPAVVFWEGETHGLPGGLTLICCGGHFEGSAVLHWPDGAEGRGVLLSGDTIDIVADARYMSFMYSYPNLIPLPASKVRRIIQAVEPFAFDRMYEAFGLVTLRDAKAGLRYSAERYIRAITD
jgi:glyoxylase-like metal-dependent hydrolase (beta-lactamase superfamily II)